RLQIALANVRQDQVLVVAAAQFAEAILVSQRRHRFHLLGSAIARRKTGLLQRQRDDGVTGLFVGMRVVFQPARERWVRRALLGQFGIGGGAVDGVVGRRLEETSGVREFGFGQRAGAVLEELPLVLDLGAERL